jgi:hypothetical protein
MTRRYSVALIFGAGMLFPRSVFACEPVIPLAMLIAGPYVLAGSLIGLPAAVTLKCTIFSLSERKLPGARAARLMLFANVVTSLVGLLMAAALAAPAVLIVLPLVFWLTLSPSRRLKRRVGARWPHWLPPWAAALLLTMSLVVAHVLFLWSREVALDAPVAYWLLKLGYVYAALAISVGLTTVWEEALVARWAKASVGVSYFPSVLRSNLYTFLALLPVAAVRVLPERFETANFLLIR